MPPENSSSLILAELGIRQAQDELETLGPDLSRFRMPDSGSGASPLTSENLCVYAFLQEKIEGLLGLFRISAENGMKEIEFISP